MMDLNKRQKMLIGTIVAGVASLALDKFVLGPPEGAAASVAEQATPAAGPAVAPGPGAAPLPTAPLPGQPPTATGTTAQPTAPADKDALPSFESLTDRLAEIQAAQSTPPLQTDADDRPDPFKMPKAWEPKKVVIAPPVEKDPEPKQPEKKTEPLKKQFKLEATYRSSSEGVVKSLAVINGRVMGKGTRIKVRLNEPLKGSEEPYEVFKLERVIVGDRKPSEVVWISEHDGRAVVIKARGVLPEASDGTGL